MSDYKIWPEIILTINSLEAYTILVYFKYKKYVPWQYVYEVGLGQFFNVDFHILSQKLKPQGLFPREKKIKLVPITTLKKDKVLDLNENRIPFYQRMKQRE